MPIECQDVTIGPGDCEVTEEFEGPMVSVSGECTQTLNGPIASGNIQAGETQNCDFLNIKGGCEEDTVWDLTLDESAGGDPVGEELCSSNGLGLQEVKIANGPFAGHFFEEFIHLPPCAGRPDVLAHASSGTPPDPPGDGPVCVDFS